MPYEPVFTITPLLLSRVEEITALRERILGASVELSWIPALQKDTRTQEKGSGEESCNTGSFGQLVSLDATFAPD